MKRAWLIGLPLLALLLAARWGPADGQERAAKPELALSKSLTRAVEAAAPHLVLIRPKGETRAARRRGRSGVVIAKDVVVTCATNVDAFGVDDLVVEDAQGRAVPARLRGRDLRLRLVVLYAEGLGVKPAPRASMDRQAGSLVLALGTPLRSDGLPTSTFGILSAVDRFQGRADQVDAGMDPSNIGGALVDIEGRLMGVLVEVDARLGNRSGVGFSIPTHLIDTALPALLRGEQLEMGDLGVGIPKVDTPGVDGVEVRSVNAKGPAASAGVLPGDRIVRLAGRSTPTIVAFRKASAPLYAGRRVEVVLRRGSEERTVELVLAVKPVPR